MIKHRWFVSELSVGNILKKPEHIYLHPVKWFQALSNTNSFISSQLKWLVFMAYQPLSVNQCQIQFIKIFIYWIYKVYTQLNGLSIVFIFNQIYFISSNQRLTIT